MIGPKQILIQDVNGDNLPDILVVANNGVASEINATAGPTFNLIDNNAGFANTALTADPTWDFTSAQVLVISGSAEDLAITNANGGYLVVALGNGDGSFTAVSNLFPTDASSGPLPMGIGVGLFDNKTDKNDLLVANSGPDNDVALFAIPQNPVAVKTPTDVKFTVNLPTIEFLADESGD